MAQQPTLGWPETKEDQKLRIKVTRWGYRLDFESFKQSPRTRFSWDGVATGPPETFEGVTVLADVKVSADSFDGEDGDDRYLPTRRGHLSVVKSVGLSLTLFVSSNAYQELLRLFAVVFAAGECGEVWIEVTLKSEMSSIPEFWQSGWHSDGLEVSRFVVFSRSSLSQERQDE
jgi:hypothetical protein